MQFLKKFFGGGGSKPEPDAQTETYKDFQITATPIREGSTYRVCALIEKDVGGEVKRHELIRADTVEGRAAAEVASVRKAKQMIDEQGERIFT